MGGLVILLSILFVVVFQTTSGASNCSPSCKSGYKCMINNCVLDVKCPDPIRFGSGLPKSCSKPTDPLKKPASKFESWFTKEVFNDLFPKANIGWGPNECSPYSYESFVIAGRYFPKFGGESPNNGYTAEQNGKRDLAAFFSHAIQETGENDASLYTSKNLDEANACFYRGGFFNWFEGGPVSGFLPTGTHGTIPSEGDWCNAGGLYCAQDPTYEAVYPCSKEKNGTLFKGCYYGRGAIQISYNYNYGMFQTWLQKQGVKVDILKNPNLLMTNMNPPLAIMASLWFYMTPQPPKPAMHDIVLGQWEAGDKNRAANYSGPIFGPTSLIINNECGGEDAKEPGGAGESRRIKAFKWFCKYFNVPTGADKTLTCKNMVQPLEMIPHKKSYQPDWSSTWKTDPCNCAPADYGGLIPYYQPKFYPQQFVDENEVNRKLCVDMLYKNPAFFQVPGDSACLQTKPKN